MMVPKDLEDREGLAVTMWAHFQVTMSRQNDLVARGRDTCGVEKLMDSPPAQRHALSWSEDCWEGFAANVFME